MDTRILSRSERARLEQKGIETEEESFWSKLTAFYREWKKERGKERLHREAEESEDTAERFSEAIKSLGVFFENFKTVLDEFSFSVQRAEQNGRPIELSIEFVGADMVRSIQRDIHADIREAERMADAEFIGPLQADEQELVNAFRQQAIGRDDFINEFLMLRGLVFSDKGDRVALSHERLSSLRREFNDDQGPSPVIVFRRAAEHTTMRPNRDFNPATAKRIPVYARR